MTLNVCCLICSAIKYSNGIFHCYFVACDVAALLLVILGTQMHAYVEQPHLAIHSGEEQLYLPTLLRARGIYLGIISRANLSKR